MKFISLGDVHGDINYCHILCKLNPDAMIIQVGDLGVGFVPLNVIKNMKPNFRFFVGNHDCRTLANSLPNCLGDFGEYEGFFFVSGADSYDKEMRTVGIDWWPDEELSYEQAANCLELWEKSKCEILLSHDCPQSIAEAQYSIYEKSHTRNLLQAMIEVRKPKMLIWGHHHQSKRFNFKGINCVALDKCEPFEFEC